MSLAVAGVSRDAVLQERVGRERARRHLVAFSEYVAPWYRAARHHRAVARYLEEVERFVRSRGKEGIGRLLIFMPPRHGKTEQVSKLFPAWILGRNPDYRVILTSYGADLAVSNSRACRDIVSGERFRALFGELSNPPQSPHPPQSPLKGGGYVELSRDSRSVEAWDLAAPARGGVVAAGVGGGITGKGAHLLIVDDPFKNRDEAESESHRNRVWDWWTSSAYTRLEDGAAVIGMLTRWHEDDWAGRLLRQMEQEEHADRYVVVEYPAIWEGGAEKQKITTDFTDGNPPRSPLKGGGVTDVGGGTEGEGRDELGRGVGEALWPEKYSVEDLMRIRANVGEYDWQALYQQAPYLRTGGMFKREWFVTVDSVAAGEGVRVLGRVRYWDKAGSSGKGDYSVGVLMAITSDDGVYVEHVERGQWSPMERERKIQETALADKERKGAVELWYEQEPGSSGLDSAQSTAMALAKMGVRSQFEPVTGDKGVRAGPFSSACQAGRVRLVRGGWNRDYVEELAAFPAGRFDDQVDASSGAFAKLVRRSASGGIHI